MNEIKVFDNAEFGKVRTTTVNGEPWFVGKDICMNFGDTNHNRTLSRVENEDKLTLPITDAIGRKQNAIFVNESGLYSILFAMQPQKANNNGVSDAYPIEVQERISKIKRFKHWVTSEVLPSIRKHGIYATDNVIDNILNNPDFGIELLTRLKSERAARIAAEEEKERLQEELDYSKDWYSIKRVAAMNGVEWKKFKWRRLKEKSIELGYGVKKIFDANYGEVNTYHRDVWEAVYPEYEI